MCTTAMTMVILGLLSVFPAGHSIKCYSCKSDKQPFCKDPFQGGKDAVVDCPRSECEKVIYSVKGMLLYERKCAMGFVSNTSCKLLEHAINSPQGKEQGVELKYCNTCVEDECNVASRPRMSGTFGVVTTLVMVWVLARI